MRLKQLVEQKNTMYLQIQLKGLEEQIRRLRQQNASSDQINRLIQRANKLQDQLQAANNAEDTSK